MSHLPMSDKKELRNRIKGLKAVQTSEHLNEQSALLMRRIEAHPLFQKAKVVLLYHSLPDEPFTHSFIEKWAAKKRLLLPVVRGEEMDLREYSDTSDLMTGAFHILEPTRQATFTDYAAIDLAIVPGVAFDANGNRLGRGKGYYDKFFSHPSTQRIHKIGLCFNFQFVKQIPADAHDVPMDEVIYPM